MTTTIDDLEEARRRLNRLIELTEYPDAAHCESIFVRRRCRLRRGVPREMRRLTPTVRNRDSG